jgi:hypothetical protein
MTSTYTKTWAPDARLERIVLSDGQKLRYLQAGSGPPLLLMHTLRTQLDYFQRLIPLLTSVHGLRGRLAGSRLVRGRPGHGDRRTGREARHAGIR